jgi:hypothetical protein
MARIASQPQPQHERCGDQRQEENEKKNKGRVSHARGVMRCERADYSASAGLLWAMNGGRLVGLHRDWAMIDMPLQNRERVFYRRNVERTKISLPWTKKAA